MGNKIQNSIHKYNKYAGLCNKNVNPRFYLKYVLGFQIITPNNLTPYLFIPFRKILLLLQ